MVDRKRFLAGLTEITLALTLTASLNGPFAATQKASGVLFFNITRYLLLINFPLNITERVHRVDVY